MDEFVGILDQSVILLSHEPLSVFFVCHVRGCGQFKGRLMEKKCYL